MSSRVKDLVVLGLLVTLIAASQVIAYLFNGSVSRTDMAIAAVCLAGFVCFAGMALWSRSGNSNSSRVAVVICLAMWAKVCAGLGSWVLLAVSAVAIFARLVPLHYWTVFRRAVLVGCLLWSVTPGVLALLMAPEVRWLSAPTPDSPEITVFLLLDEFNASAADPVEQALIASGVEFKRKSLVPVGRDTLKVVPAMFTGKTFDRAGVCSATSVCSGRTVFDFTRVVVERQDVDVVGVAMPYCAIKGLRHCETIPFVSKPFDPGSWRCVIGRRWTALVSVFHRMAPRSCPDNSSGEVEGRAEEAISRAPVWREGGVLFAHLILPHPPGKELPLTTLAADYAKNVLRAAGVVADLVRRLKATQRTFRLVIFSDHPLRRIHCTGFLYAKSDCLRADLFDDRVPLFVAGNVPPAFDEISSNVDVFRLASP